MTNIKTTSLFVVEVKEAEDDKEKEKEKDIRVSFTINHFSAW